MCFLFSYFASENRGTSAQLSVMADREHWTYRTVWAMRPQTKNRCFEAQVFFLGSEELWLRKGQLSICDFLIY
ncbi:hypothetical protein ACTXT7_001818 [Hymenolepis weldensis]